MDNNIFNSLLNAPSIITGILAVIALALYQTPKILEGVRGTLKDKAEEAVRVDRLRAEESARHDKAQADLLITLERVAQLFDRALQTVDNTVGQLDVMNLGKAASDAAARNALAQLEASNAIVAKQAEEIAGQKAEVAGLKAEIAKLTARIAALEKKPARKGKVKDEKKTVVGAGARPGDVAGL